MNDFIPEGTQVYLKSLKGELLGLATVSKIIEDTGKYEVEFKGFKVASCDRDCLIVAAPEDFKLGYYLHKRKGTKYKVDKFPSVNELIKQTSAKVWELSVKYRAVDEYGGMLDDTVYNTGLSRFLSNFEFSGRKLKGTKKAVVKSRVAHRRDAECDPEDDDYVLF